MAIRYASAPTTDQLNITISQEQAKLLHAALCDAVLVTRDHQLRWLDAHENRYVSPDVRAEAWNRFKEWERRESLSVELLKLLRSTGIELDQQEFGLR